MLLKHREGIKNTKVVDKGLLRKRSQNISGHFPMYLTPNHTEYSIYSEKHFIFMLHQQTELFSNNEKRTKQASLRAKSANTDRKHKCVHGDYIKAHWCLCDRCLPLDFIFLLCKSRTARRGTSRVQQDRETACCYLNLILVIIAEQTQAAIARWVNHSWLRLTLLQQFTTLIFHYMMQPKGPCLVCDPL